MSNTFNFTHVDNSTRFPSRINVHEHRAPTDESVRLLNEMESKALENVFLKISDDRDNAFSYSMYFSRICGADPFEQKGMFHIRFKINGKLYTRTVSCSKEIYELAMRHFNGEPLTLRLSELAGRLRTFVLFQAALLVAHVMIECPDETLSLMFEHASMGDPMKFNIDTLRKEIMYDGRQ